MWIVSVCEWKKNKSFSFRVGVLGASRLDSQLIVIYNYIGEFREG